MVNQSLPLLTKQWRRRFLVLTSVSALGALPVLAQSGNFAPINLSANFPPAAGTVQGSTGGSYSLSAIANRDGAGHLCVGYADSNPDHIMTLQEDFPRLSIQVDSGGNDTTLVIQGPDNSIRCGDDTGRNKDASIGGDVWAAGSYRVWVGAFDSGARYSYTLRVSR